MKKPIKLLWLSFFPPAKNARYAGQQTSYYYVRELSRNPVFEVTLVTFEENHPGGDLGYASEHFQYEFVMRDGKLRQLLHRILQTLLRRLNPWLGNGGLVALRSAHRLFATLRHKAKSGFRPDIVFCDFTQISLLVKDLKTIFPDSAWACHEHDVSFQSMLRQSSLRKTAWGRFVAKRQADTLREAELVAMKEFAHVLVPSRKDALLLEKEGIGQDVLGILTPKFQQRGSPLKRAPGRDVIFFGAMNRMENVGACVWFASEVLPRLRALQLGIRFVIVGGNPPESLLKLANDNDLVVTGFVENPLSYFEQALCLAVPLLSGGGVKVKVLEALVSGVPVLANAIGVEGIPVEHERHYLHCELPEDYVKAIQFLLKNPDAASEMANRAVEAVMAAFDYELALA